MMAHMCAVVPALSGSHISSFGPLTAAASRLRSKGGSLALCRSSPLFPRDPSMTTSKRILLVEDSEDLALCSRNPRSAATPYAWPWMA